MELKKIMIYGLVFLFLVVIVYAVEQKVLVNLNMMGNNIINVTWTNSTNFNATQICLGNTCITVWGAYNATYESTYNSTYDAKPSNTYNISYNSMLGHNTSVEIIAAVNTTSYFQIQAKNSSQVYNVSYDSMLGHNTTEEIQDAGGTQYGGTETLITVTYDDANNDIDFVVNNDLHSYSWANVVDADISNTLTCSDLVAGSSVVADSEVDNAITINGAVWVNTSTGMKVNDNTKFYFGTDSDWCMYFDGVSLITSNSC